MPRKSNITVICTEEERERWHAIAKRECIPLSVLIRRLLAQLERKQHEEG